MSVVVAALLVLHLRMTGSAAYAGALRIAQASPAVKESLGSDIHYSSTAKGLTYSPHGAEFTEFSAGIAGSKGDGRLYAAANTINQELEFSRVTFVPNDSSGGRIDLTPPPGRLVMPKVPHQTVYLAPLGLEPSQSLEWAPAYYKAKFDIAVNILPAVPVTEELVDRKRQQVNPQKSIEYLCALHPEVARDTSALMFAVTSRDIYIPADNRTYTVNYREAGRFAMVSAARLGPYSVLGASNPDWVGSRLQKVLTKNIAMLYFNLPMSSDYTSLLSGGRLTGSDVDAMSGKLIGVEGKWESFVMPGPLGIRIIDLPGKPVVWRNGVIDDFSLDIPGQAYLAHLGVGGFAMQATDFALGGKYPLKLSRTYMTGDLEPRQFGVGFMDSLDTMLVGQMGVYAETKGEYGQGVRYEHYGAIAGQDGDVYLPPRRSGKEDLSWGFVLYKNNLSIITDSNGWKYRYPFLGKALKHQVCVVTGYSDPEGHEYKMERNSFGDLLSVTNPDEQWLHFERDESHRVARVTASSGRIVTYEYDAGGRLSRVTGSDGVVDSYTYDDRSEMLSVTRGNEKPAIRNDYGTNGFIIKQTLADDSYFEYHYDRHFNRRNGDALVADVIKDPNGYFTYINADGAEYESSLPKPAYQ